MTRQGVGRRGRHKWWLVGFPNWHVSGVSGLGNRTSGGVSRTNLPPYAPRFDINGSVTIIIVIIMNSSSSPPSSRCRRCYVHNSVSHTNLTRCALCFNSLLLSNFSFIFFTFFRQMFFNPLSLFVLASICFLQSPSSRFFFTTSYTRCSHNPLGLVPLKMLWVPLNS